ncbi:transcriptional repressor TraM (plasmid) [Agrobacterium vitis]
MGNGDGMGVKHAQMSAVNTLVGVLGYVPKMATN